MAELPSRVYLLDTAELCLAAGQLLARRFDDSAAVQLAAGPIIAWAMAWHDQLDAEARRKAVKLVLAAMGAELERAPGGTAIRDPAAFVAAAEAWRHTLMCAATVPAGHPEHTPDPPAAPRPVPGFAFQGGRVMYLVRTLLAAAFTAPGERERLVALAVRYGRTAERPPTTGEYAAVLAYLFRHDPAGAYPGTAGTGYETGYAQEQPAAPPGGPQPAATDPADTEPGRNPGAYGDAGAGQAGGLP
jgi:hypothetical protein